MTEILCGSLDEPETCYFMKNNIVTQVANIKSKKTDTPAVRILQFSDMHINLVNDEDRTNEEVMYTSTCRKWLANGASVPMLQKLMKYSENFDATVITGDTMDYLTAGATEVLKNEVWGVNPDTLVAVGGHDVTRQMQTGLSDKTSLQSRLDTIAAFWENDIYYVSRIIADKVMLIVLNNGSHCYFDCQVEPLQRDIEYARTHDLIILIFQHEPICTGNPEDETVAAFRVYSGETRNFYSGAIGCPLNAAKESAATKEVYRLLTTNADVIAGFFTGHYHTGLFTRVNCTTDTGEQTTLPQYDCLPGAYDGSIGHVIEITVE